MAITRGGAQRAPRSPTPATISVKKNKDHTDTKILWTITVKAENGDPAGIGNLVNELNAALDGIGNNVQNYNATL